MAKVAKTLSTLVLVSKLILLRLRGVFFNMKGLLFCCSNIVVVSVRIFRNLVVGQEYIFRCAIERCMISRLDRVVDVKPTYILLLLDIQSPKGHLN